MPQHLQRPAHCTQCGAELPPAAKTGQAGYGVDHTGNKICYNCCASMARDDMRQHGRITLYLTVQPGKPPTISNWPGTLTYEAYATTHGKHNIAHTRTDVWFYDQDGCHWHGVQYGNATQLVHCRRLKR